MKLHGYDCLERIILADIDVTFANALHQRTKKSRFEVVQINAMETAALAQFLKEHKIAVTLNACPWIVNHSVLEACAHAGSHYLDMAADIYSPPGVKRPGKNSFEAEIEKFNHLFLDKHIAGILCMGMDPGAVNVFARWAMDRLDTASSIRVLDGDNAEVKGYRFAVLFNPETLFEELGAVPYYVKEGRVSSGKQLETEVDWVRFPDPIGLMKTYAVAHEEGVSLGTYPPFVDKGVRYSVFKYTLSDKVVQLARSLALLDLDTWKRGSRPGARGLCQSAQAGPVGCDRGRLLLRRHRGAWNQGSEAGRILHLYDGQPPRGLRAIRVYPHRSPDGHTAGPRRQALGDWSDQGTRSHDARSVGPGAIDGELYS
jgi:saccharopine dehydrogenase-like NADP-dependent oxidoreductase